MRLVLLTCMVGISLMLALAIFRFSTTHSPTPELVSKPTYLDAPAPRASQPASSAANTDNRGTATIIDANDFMPPPTNTTDLNPFDLITDAGDYSSTSEEEGTEAEERQIIPPEAEISLPAPAQEAFSSIPATQAQAQSSQHSQPLLPQSLIIQARTIQEETNTGEDRDLAAALIELIQGNRRQESSADETPGRRMIEELNSIIESDVNAAEFQEH